MLDMLSYTKGNKIIRGMKFKIIKYILLLLYFGVIYRNNSVCKYQLGIVKTFQIIEGHFILLNLKQIEFDNCASCRGEKDK